MNRIAPVTYQEIYSAYRSLLIANPGKALRLNGESVMVLEDDVVCCAALVDGKVDMLYLCPITQDGWDDDQGCWEAGNYVETFGIFESPQFVVDVRSFSCDLPTQQCLA